METMSCHPSTTTTTSLSSNNDAINSGLLPYIPRSKAVEGSSSPQPPSFAVRVSLNFRTKFNPGYHTFNANNVTDDVLKQWVWELCQEEIFQMLNVEMENEECCFQEKAHQRVSITSEGMKEHNVRQSVGRDSSCKSRTIDEDDDNDVNDEEESKLREQSLHVASVSPATILPPASANSSIASLSKSRKRMVLLETISNVQRMCLVDNQGPNAVFGNLLQAILSLTDSEYGFIGEVKLHPETDKPFLRTHAITNLAWDKTTNDFVTEHFMSDEGLNFFNTHTLFGHVMTQRQVVIANTPQTDERRSPKGLPPGHPPLDHFLGIPFFAPGTQKPNGMVGIANKPGGYSELDVKFLEPFILTCGALIEAYKAIQSNKNLLETLEAKVAERTQELEQAHQLAEKLLQNMLPTDIARRLKQNPSKMLADYHEHAVVLFADICHFTQFADDTPAPHLVEVLNDIFTRFDALVEHHGLNKIKTIGDAYMVASVPQVSLSSRENDYRQDCLAACQLALDLVQAMQVRNKQFPEAQLDLRVGLEIGPVVAGVVGTKRFLYDLWGDSVNVASRMESTGLPGRIQVTKNVKELVETDFRFEARGEITVKGKGVMQTWFLEPKKGIKRPLAT